MLRVVDLGMESQESGGTSWTRGRLLFAMSIVLVVGAVGVVAAQMGDEGEPEVVVDEDDDRVPAPVDDLAASVAATLELNGWELTLVQEMESFDAELTATVVGTTSSMSQRLGSTRSNQMIVDGTLYEDDGTGWHLKPVPAAQLQAVMLEEFIGGFAELPGRELDRSDGVVRVEVLCDEIDRASASQLARDVCPAEGEVIARIDEASGRLVSVQIEGSIETYPDRFQDGTIDLSITPAGDRAPFEAPVRFSTDRAQCLADAVGVDLADTTGLALALDATTTEENAELYGSCGFDLYPPGWDFRD